MSTLDGSPDDGLTIRAALKALAAKSVGGSFRWAVNTSLSGDLQVQVTKSFLLQKTYTQSNGENRGVIIMCLYRERALYLPFSVPARRYCL